MRAVPVVELSCIGFGIEQVTALWRMDESRRARGLDLVSGRVIAQTS